MLLFFKQAVPATSSGNCAVAGYTSEETHVEPEGFAVRQFEAFITADVTAGTLVVTLYKNAVAVATAVLTLSDLVMRAAVQLSGVGLAPGDRMTVGWVSAGLAPTTADLVAVVS